MGIYRIYSQINEENPKQSQYVNRVDLETLGYLTDYMPKNLPGHGAKVRK